MALFDSYAYDPSTYQGGGGLIDRLIGQLQTQQQYQPSPGAGRTFDAATFDPQTYAPNQAAPIAVGNYQMPRIGDASQFASDPAAIPVNAQPTQGQVPPPQVVSSSVGPTPQQPPLPSILQAPGNGLLDHLNAGFQTLHHGGGLISSLIAGVTGQRNDAQAQQQEILRSQYQSLIPILGEAKARLAVLNPDIGKVMLTEALSNKEKFGKVGQDGLGREQYGFINERDQTVNGKPISALPQDTNGGGIGNMDLSGQPYLDSLPKQQANIVKGMVEGTIAPPSSFAMAKPYWANLISAAKNYDPTFDATNWSGRLAGIKDFSAGKSSEMVRSANQTLHHAGGLLDSMDALNNGNYPLINKIGNAANEATGGGAPTSFRLNAHAVADELSKVFKGQGISDAEIRAWEQNLSENASPEQQRAAVAKLRDLLQGSLSALEEKRLNSIGQIAADKQGPLIKDEGQRVLERMQSWISKGTGAAQGASPGQTKTGVSWSVVK